MWICTDRELYKYDLQGHYVVHPLPLVCLKPKVCENMHKSGEIDNHHVIAVVVRGDTIGVSFTDECETSTARLVLYNHVNSRLIYSHNHKIEVCFDFIPGEQLVVLQDEGAFQINLSGLTRNRVSFADIMNDHLEYEWLNCKIIDDVRCILQGKRSIQLWNPKSGNCFWKFQIKMPVCEIGMLSEDYLGCFGDHYLYVIHLFSGRKLKKIRLKHSYPFLYDVDMYNSWTKVLYTTQGGFGIVSCK